MVDKTFGPNCYGFHKHDASQIELGRKLEIVILSFECSMVEAEILRHLHTAARRGKMKHSLLWFLHFSRLN